MKNNENEIESNLSGLYILFSIILLIWVLSLIVLRWKYPAISLRGPFGDSFGAINSIFSGLALAGIIYTIFLQKKELSLQRQELRDTREEFKIQNRTLRLQRFENTFFKLLDLHHKIVDGIDLVTYKEKETGMPFRRIMRDQELDIITLEGRDVFKEKYDQLINDIAKSKEGLNKAYLKFYQGVQTDLGHYFRNLYRIIKLVNETEFISQEELRFKSDEIRSSEILNYMIENHELRYRYTSIVRAQLSDYELLWLFYNCLSDNGNKKFKPLLEKYCLLKNMPQNRIHNSELIKEYSDDAYTRKK